MHFTSSEIEKLLLVTAGKLAGDRLGRKLKLNYPEAVAFLSWKILEKIRDGQSIEEIKISAHKILRINQTQEGIPEMIKEIQVEGTFSTGNHLVSIKNPISEKSGDVGEKEYVLVPGEYFLTEDDVNLNEGSVDRVLKIFNTSDQKIFLGSHLDLSRSNRSLSFIEGSIKLTHELLKGYRLNIPSGNMLYLSPGDTRDINVIKNA